VKDASALRREQARVVVLVMAFVMALVMALVMAISSCITSTYAQNRAHETGVSSENTLLAVWKMRFA
jgi:hypothetical protein